MRSTSRTGGCPRPTGAATARTVRHAPRRRRGALPGRPPRHGARRDHAGHQGEGGADARDGRQHRQRARHRQQPVLRDDLEDRRQRVVDPARHGRAVGLPRRVAQRQPHLLAAGGDEGRAEEDRAARRRARWRARPSRRSRASSGRSRAPTRKPSTKPVEVGPLGVDLLAGS